MRAMQRGDFYYDLPEELIAQYPTQQRDASRLLCLDAANGVVEDRYFSELSTLLRPGDLLVLNDTRVIPARLLGQKESGGKIEVLVEKILDEHSILAQIRASKPPRLGSHVIFNGKYQAQVLNREGEFYELYLEDAVPVHTLLNEMGHIPLPPYIQRPDKAEDSERYQTVYAHKSGAVAAPTAGLHFTQDLLDGLQAKGIELAYVTLHVGAGTFQPMRVDDIHQHRMHSEYTEITAGVCQQIQATQRRGGRVVAVGTTSVRCLETATKLTEGSNGKNIAPFSGETDIFIYPGYEFKVVDVLLTNFHLPESTLLMLICAFAGYENTLAAYGHAITQSYRFFSYGDAMLVTNGRQSMARSSQNAIQTSQ